MRSPARTGAFTTAVCARPSRSSIAVPSTIDTWAGWLMAGAGPSTSLVVDGVLGFGAGDCASGAAAAVVRSGILAKTVARTPIAVTRGAAARRRYITPDAG